MKKIFLFYTLFFAFISWAQKQSTIKTKSFNLGVIEEIDSKILNEKRTLNIYLPEGYSEKDTTKYPVIYLLDGSANEDFIHIVGLVQYNNFSWIDRVPKSIVVGIANVDRRRDFTSPTTFKTVKERYPSSGGSENFISFIEKELQPFIEKKYNTSTKTIIGQSLGGLLVTEVLFKKPELFDKYIIISPSLWWNDGELLKANPKILEETSANKKDIYLGVGKEGLGPVFDNHVMEVDANILYDKIKYSKNKNINIYFDYLPAEDHATVTHPAVFNAFRILYPKKVTE
ncbi:MAG: alpha/beta hydrolase-fold protein [Limnohabitans sp.]|nr:alpha/beta hydrolase-fold protein [Limnohabitans sp.]